MKNRFTRILLTLAAGALAAAMLAASASAADYEKLRAYDGRFTDVSESAWYYGNVTGAYELGLINGKSETSFDPDGNLTVAETIKLAAVSHQLLTKGAVDDETFSAEGAAHWYDPYVTYAVQRDIVTEAYEDYNAPATRGMVAVLFSRALNTSGVTNAEINEAEFGSLADVPTDAWYVSAVYRMFRWGILVGDENGLLHPESKVKRSEMSAIVTRVVDPAVRVLRNGSTAEPLPAGEEPGAAAPAVVTNGVLVLRNDETFAMYEPAEGPEGFAADFTVGADAVSLNASYCLAPVNYVAAEADNICFRLYDNGMFPTLREKLKNAAVGANGTKVREASEVYTEINDLFTVWVDGERKTVGGLWYADHEGYTEYAFYLEESLDLASASSYRLVCGEVAEDAMKANGLDTVATLAESAATVVTGDAVEAPAAENSEEYAAAVEAAKSTAVTVPFEYESDRCYILYGAGLYGTGEDDYRLLFIFRDGTSQTIANQKLTAIRVNSAGTVLYYTVTAPDGGSIQYGVNFDG